MRRIVVAGMSTVSGLVLLFSYHTSTNRAEASTESLPSIGGASDSSTPAADSDAANAPAKKATKGKDKGTSTASAAKTFTGDAVDTGFGDIKVQITVEGKKITKSDAIAYPNAEQRDLDLSKSSVPKLNAAAVQKQSAKLDIVSGATETSQGYAKSLQSAIDQAFA
jgi:uncharacterized protein with FMN-binding domain